LVDTNWTGEEKYYDQYGEDSMIEIMSRLQDTPLQSPDHRRRRVTPRHYVSNTLEDPFEALQMLVDPKSTYMQAKKAAMARKTDELLISALGGSAFTGKTGATEVTLGAAQKTTVGAGITKAKILEAKQILDAGEVDKEDRFCVISAKQFEELLSIDEVASSDYNTIKALVQGEVDTWVGFTFLHSEQLSVDASSRRLTYWWQRKGLQLAIQRDVMGRIDERPDKNYAWQVYLRSTLGATRLEEARVVEMACVES